MTLAEQIAAWQAQVAAQKQRRSQAAKKAWRTRRSRQYASPSYGIEDDGAILYDVQATARSRFVAVFRVFGRVVIDGQHYEGNAAAIRVRLRKVPGPQASE